MTITIASTSTKAHSLRLQRNRRSITLTTGTSTAALKMETKIRRRTFAIDASAQAMATAPATSRIVGIDIETSTPARPAAVAREEGSPVLIRRQVGGRLGEPASRIPGDPHTSRNAPQPDRHRLSPERRFESLEPGDDRSSSRL